MSPTLISSIVYGVLALLAAVLSHFGFLPADIVNIIFGAAGLGLSSNAGAAVAKQNILLGQSTALTAAAPTQAVNDPGVSG